MNLLIKNIGRHSIFFVAIALCLQACKMLEQASLHGLNSGYYTLHDGEKPPAKVYTEVEEDEIRMHATTNAHTDSIPFLKVSFRNADSPVFQQIVLKKQGLDLDITSVLMKYRPAVSGLPAQLTTDLDLALYAGWRWDRFELTNAKTPLGKYQSRISNRGFDVGFFAGPGATLISPFTTLGNRPDEYNGMVMQAGFAGFLETSMASFGIAAGFDHLFSPDRKVWIYNRKPWLGFVVGIALN